jgi:hypothetical protein
MTTIAVIGTGTVGRRVARHLTMSPGVERLVLGGRRPAQLRSMVEQFEIDVTVVEPGPIPEADVVVLSLPAGGHAGLAEEAVARGAHVVSTSDAIADVQALLELDETASKAGRTVVVGAAFSPGVSCLLARHGAALFDSVEEVHVSRAATGGPACARQLHRARTALSIDWWGDGWRRRPGGTGRELVWFPDPMGARDCYRAGLSDALLLAPEFPTVDRITARIAATRRDRLTAVFPMFRPPHADGGPGALRVELRGVRGSARHTEVFGVMDHPSAGAAAMATVAALRVARDGLDPGAWGLARIDDPVPWLTDLAQRGVRAAVYTGADDSQTTTS